MERGCPQHPRSVNSVEQPMGGASRQGDNPFFYELGVFSMRLNTSSAHRSPPNHPPAYRVLRLRRKLCGQSRALVYWQTGKLVECVFLIKVVALMIQASLLSMRVVSRATGPIACMAFPCLHGMQAIMPHGPAHKSS